MPELLLELGCEELPATFVRKAYGDLQSNLTNLLGEAGVLEGGSVAMGTPRRLIVSFEDLLPRQEDKTVEQRGPAIQAAYDKDGNPTPALLGFCKGQGVDPIQLKKDDKYVWATRAVKGKDTKELLRELIPQAIRSLTFEKSMRWGSSRMRFARPIRWILASFDGQAVDFEIEGVRSGLQSRGHRFYKPENFEATTLGALKEGLKAHFVEPDPDRRKELILAGAAKVATGIPDIPDALLDENVFLTEWPTALEGQFKEEFMELPRPVLVIAMAKHERFFPVRDKENNLTNRFVSIRNGGEDATVRKGNEWVLNARFNDAKFFFDEDAKHTFADFLEKTQGILFQDRLGTVRQRADRLSSVAAEVARLTHADQQEIDFARQAGLYAKADLSTGLVSELASLQGVIGGEYARREGFPDPVCWAIASHYDLGKNPKPDCEGARTAVRTLIADQLDKLAGYLGLGLEPTGSSDPFGLRRAATQLIEAAWAWPAKLPGYAPMMAAANEAYLAQGIVLDGANALKLLSTLFASRYEALLPDTRHDILDAATLEEDIEAVLNPQALKVRITCVQRLAEDNAFVHTATRPANIVAAAQKKGIEIGKPSRLDSTEGENLLKTLMDTERPLSAAVQREDAAEICTLLQSLAAPINAFFDSTMVMVEDAEIRSSRLALLQFAQNQLLTAGDFTKIVIEG
jgi:glycyl-tRNA synthetase beta chain